MKNKFLTVLMAIVLALGCFSLTACTQNTENDKMIIYTSFYPLYDFASKVGGNKVEVFDLVKPGEEAHGYEPTTQQMVGMTNADLIIYSGVGMEGWVDDLSSTMGGKLINATQNITLLTREDDGDEEEADLIYDPHVWQNVNNAKQMMLNIKNALVSHDSQNANYYESNYEKYAVLFDGLDSEYSRILSIYEGDTIIVSHKAFSYLCDAYNINQYSLSGIESDSEPNAQTLASVIDFINANNVKAIFYQTNANSQVAESIANQTSAKLYLLSSVESLTQKELDDGEDYLTVMARNLATLKIALA